MINAEPKGSRRARPAGWQHWVPLPIYLLLTVVLTWPLVTRLGVAIPGDSFDGWQNFWNLWWVRVAIVERLQSPLFTDLLYAPTGVSLAFHTLNPFNGLLTLPVQFAAGSGARGLFLAYISVVLFSFTMSGYGAFLLTLWALRPRPGGRGTSQETVDPRARWWGALVAGAIFAFAPFHMAHLLGHMQVFAYQWVPFTAWALLRTLDQAGRGRAWLRPALLAAIFFAFMALCDWYFALYTLLFGLGALTWQGGRRVVMREWAAVGRMAVASAVAGAVALLMLSPLLAPMVREAARNDYMVRPATDLYTYSASVADFFIPSRMHSLFRPGSLEWPGNQVAPVSERTLAIGYVALILLAAGLLLDRKRAGGWVVAALLFGLLALGPRPHLGNITATDLPPDAPLNELSLYNAVNALVPFMRISRSVSRFALMVQLAVSVAAGIGLAALVRRLRWPAGAAGSLAMALVLAEFWVAPYPLSPPDTPAWYTSAQAQVSDPERPALLNLPMNYDRPGYLLYQTEHGRPLAVAYISRDDPRTLTERVPLLQHLRHLAPDIIEADLAAVGPTVLRDLGVGTVVLDRYKMPGGKEREVTEAIAAEVFGDRPPIFADERITVYEAPAVEQPAAYLRLETTGWAPLTRTSDGEPMGRLVGAEPAGVTLLHGTGDERLHIAYSGAGTLFVAGSDGASLQTLPPAPTVASTVVDMPADGIITLRGEGGEVLIAALSIE